MKHQWNTGRQYEADGQRMVAEVRDNSAELTGDMSDLGRMQSWIAFSDLSRYINGRVMLGDFLRGDRLDKYAIETLVMTNYDYGNYSGSRDTLSWD